MFSMEESVEVLRGFFSLLEHAGLRLQDGLSSGVPGKLWGSLAAVPVQGHGLQLLLTPHTSLQRQTPPQLALDLFVHGGESSHEKTANDPDPAGDRSCSPHCSGSSRGRRRSDPAAKNTGTLTPRLYIVVFIIFIIQTR